MVGRKGLSVLVGALAVSIGALVISTGAASATTSIAVSPSTGLSDGATVTVGVSGFTDGPGAITECNTATPQPTIQVAGNDVPVSCTNPFNSLQTVAGGGFTGKTFTVHTGTVGPPAQGTDSAGKPASQDAPQFPCPPTAAQAAAGAKCVIAFGNANKEQATADIAFASTGGSTTPTSSAPVTTGATAAPTTAATTAPTTATTVATQVLGEQVTNQVPGSPPPGQMATTGSSWLTAALAVAGLALLDLGYLAWSSTRAPRRMLRRLRKGVVART